MNYIYSILNVITNKSYIGKTNNPKQRKRVHMQKLRSNKHGNIKLQRSYNKYGEENFKFIILYETENENWSKYEEMFIELFNTTNDIYGYNIGKGGESNMITKEIQERQKQSNRRRVKNVLQIANINNEYRIINKFESANQAGEKTGIARTHITDCCNLKSQSTGGFYWCYEDDFNEKWLPPLHNSVKKVITEVDINGNIIKMYRCKDESATSRKVYKKLAKTKDSPICEYEGKYYTFKTREDYYNFILNRTCRD